MFPSRVNCTKSPINTQSNTLSNNHKEADNRIFWLCSIMNGDICRESSTESSHSTEAQRKKHSYSFQKDWPRVCLLLDQLTWLVNLISSSSTYSLLTTWKIDVSKIIGVMHFIAGCDIPSFLCGFTKDYCFKMFNKHSDVICPESADDAEKIGEGKQPELNVLIIALLQFWIRYYQKFLFNFRPGCRSDEVLQ